MHIYNSVRTNSFMYIFVIINDKYLIFIIIKILITIKFGKLASHVNF